MPRGRPVYSVVRENMIEMIAVKGKAYGSDIYRDYRQIFPKVTRRLMYYHLRKGVALGEFKVHSVVREKGDFSWGPEVEKTYYELGPNAKPKGDARVRKHFSRK